MIQIVSDFEEAVEVQMTERKAKFIFFSMIICSAAISYFYLFPLMMDCIDKNPNSFLVFFLKYMPEDTASNTPEYQKIINGSFIIPLLVLSGLSLLVYFKLLKPRITKEEERGNSADKLFLSELSWRNIIYI